MTFCNACSDGRHKICRDTSCRCNSKNHKDFNVTMLPSGRQIDILVAERLMGWTDCRADSSFDNAISVVFGLGLPPDGWQGHSATFSNRFIVPPFSTDDGVATLVFDALRRRFGWVRIAGNNECRPDLDNYQCVCEDATGWAPTIALAICRCALDLVERRRKARND